MNKMLQNSTVSYDKVSNCRKFCQVHYHTEYELYYLIKGETKYFIGDEIFCLKKGDFIFVPKGILHAADSQECLYNERMLVSFDDNMIGEDIMPFLEQLSTKKLIHMPSGKRCQVEEMLHRLEKEYTEKNDYHTLMLKHEISELLIFICRCGYNYSPQLSGKNAAMQEISEYIGENYQIDLSLKSLSKRFAISESHLSRCFKAFSGIGLNEYVKYVRIHHAADLLENTTASICEISARCGFNDSNYFANIFKKVKGTTPHQYAAQFRKKKKKIL